MNGDLPEPRASQTIERFSASRSGTAVTAAWHVASPLPGDRAILTAESGFTLTGMIFGGQTNVRQAACRAAVADGEFLFPSIESQWGLSLPQGHVISMNLATVTDYVFTAEGSDSFPKAVDFVLVRIRNGATATTTPALVPTMP